MKLFECSVSDFAGLIHPEPDFGIGFINYDFAKIIVPLPIQVLRDLEALDTFEDDNPEYFRYLIHQICIGSWLFVSEDRILPVVVLYGEDGFRFSTQEPAFGPDSGFGSIVSGNTIVYSGTMGQAQYLYMYWTSPDLGIINHMPDWFDSNFTSRKRPTGQLKLMKMIGQDI